MLERTTDIYQQSRGQVNLGDVVAETVKKPPHIQNEVLAFLERERDIHTQFAFHADQLLSTSRLHPAMRSYQMKDLGIAWRNAPDVLALSGIHLTPAVLENQRRFQILMDDIFRLAPTGEVSDD